MLEFHWSTWLALAFLFVAILSIVALRAKDNGGDDDGAV